MAPKPDNSAAVRNVRINCRYCDRSFNEKEAIEQHANASHGTPVVARRISCRYRGCERSFKQKEGMEKHYTHSHETAVPAAPCEYDNFRVREKTLIFVYRELSINKEPAEHQQTPPKPDLSKVISNVSGAGKKVVACNDCGKSFQTTKQLHQHQLDSFDHTRVSRGCGVSDKLTCSMCSTAFEHSDFLEQHFQCSHAVSALGSTDRRKYQYLEMQFLQSWKNTQVKVHNILKLYNPGWRRHRFEDYRKKLKIKQSQKTERSKDLRVINNGNEVERYHGTVMRCNFGDGERQMCNKKGCSLCNIMKVGFKKSKCRMERFQRFGRGIYVTATSRKANDYVSSDSSSSGTKAILICQVLAGKVYKTWQNQVDLSSPPEGYDSVCAEPGVDLNYDELVIYKDKAILPAYVIFYTTH